MRILLLTLALFTTYYYANAQEIPIGFKAGLNVSNIVIQGSNNTPYKNFHIGIFSKLELSPKFCIIPELQFIRKGFVANDGNAIRLGYRLDYIELPVLGSYRVLQRLAIEAGPSASLKVGNHPYLATFKSSDIGIVGGVRLEVTPKISLLARYYRGMTSVNDAYINTGTQRELRHAYNTNLQFSCAYYLKSK